MSLPVTIENDALRVEVYPHFGGKIASIVDKADKYELLFDYAAELPTSTQYDRAYAESWHAGWDECFPAIAAGPYPVHPYTGIGVPDHGELWGLPATAAPARAGITTVWHGLRFGYIFTRKLYLDASSIVAEYSVANLAPFDFRFVWAQHALLALPHELKVRLNPSTFRLSHDAQGRELNALFEWPQTSEGLDFSRPDSLPSRQGWKLFGCEPIRSAARVVYPSRARQIAIEYSSTGAVDGYWGVWISTGGWMGHRHIALEPTTGRFDHIDRSVKDGSAGRVAASSRCEWSVRWTAGPADS